MYCRLLQFVCLALVVAAAPLVLAEAPVDDVIVVEVAGDPASPQDFKATPMIYGPRPADPSVEAIPLPLPLIADRGQSDRPREMVTFDMRSRTAHYTLSSPTFDQLERRTPSGMGGALSTQSDNVENKDFGALFLVPYPTIEIGRAHV